MCSSDLNWFLSEIKKNHAIDTGQSVNDFANQLENIAPNLSADKRYEIKKALQEFALGKQIETFGETPDANPAYVKEVYKNKSPEEKKQFNDQILNEFIAKINQESKDAGEPLKLPTVDEYYARKQAVSKWIDTVARNYMEKDLGSITTKEGKDVSSDIVIKLLAEGYSPLTDKEIADMVKSNVNQRDTRAMRKELGFESSGYFAKDLSALAKSLKKEEASLTALLDDFNARYERAMQTNHEREARGQETLDPGVIDPSLRDLKKQEKAMRASISEIQHKIAEHKNAQKMEFAIDSAMSEGTLLPHWKSYKLDNDTDKIGRAHV